MKKTTLIIAIALVFASLVQAMPVVATVSVAESVKPQNASQSQYDLPLCQPGFYNTDPGDCLPLGPSQKVSELKEQGFPYPMRGLSAHAPDASLSALPLPVAFVDSTNTPIYGSLNDAIEGGTPISSIVGSGGRYVSMVESAYHDGRSFVRTMSGGWVEAVPHYNIPAWQGLEFFETPNHNFGFTIDNINSFVSPSFSAARTQNYYPKYASFPIYHYAEAEGFTWYQLAPDEWIPSQKAREVLVDTSRPEGVPRDRWIAIDLDNQTLAVYEDGELKFATVIASGVGGLYSDPGAFEVYHKIELHTMRGSYEADRADYFFYENIPWSLYYHHTQAIHGIYWPTTLGFPQSHGCINMFPGDAHWLFNWAELGDYVYVFDPSGRTPIPTPTPVGTPPQPIFTPTPNP